MKFVGRPEQDVEFDYQKNKNTHQQKRFYMSNKSVNVGVPGGRTVYAFAQNIKASEQLQEPYVQQDFLSGKIGGVNTDANVLEGYHAISPIGYESPCAYAARIQKYRDTKKRRNQQMRILKDTFPFCFHGYIFRAVNKWNKWNFALADLVEVFPLLEKEYLFMKVRPVAFPLLENYMASSGEYTIDLNCLKQSFKNIPPTPLSNAFNVWLDKLSKQKYPVCLFSDPVVSELKDSIETYRIILGFRDSVEKLKAVNWYSYFVEDESIYEDRGALS